MKVAIYVRVSTEDQADEGFSIDGQIKALSDWCDRNKHEVVAVYKDEGISAKNLKRPGVQKLFADCASSTFDMVAVWDVSRLSRKLKDILTAMEIIIDNNNVRFYSLQDNNDYTSPQARVTLQIMGSIAELQRSTIITNVKMGMTQRAREGYWNGGILLGYRSDNKMLKIVEDEASIVRLIFSWYTEGYGYKAIANRLNHAGYKTKKGIEFSITSVRGIVCNPTYAGFIRFNTIQNWSDKRRRGKSDPTIVKGEHEPIIDEATWQKAQDILSKKSGKSAKTFSGHFPLTTLLRCPQCGKGMVGHKNKSKNQTEYIRYYQCGTFHRKGSAVCSANSVRADWIEADVFTRLEKLLSDSEYLNSIVTSLNEKISQQKQPLVDNLNYINGQLHHIQRNINKYLALFESDSFPAEALKERLHGLEKDKVDLQYQKSEIEKTLAQPTIKEISAKDIQKSLRMFGEVLPKASPEKQKALLHSLVKEITVTQANSITERKVDKLELMFDTSLKDERVLTYDTVHRA